MMTTKIILIRHAQSIKNLKDIHGGNGESLTLLGKKQVDALIFKLLDIGVSYENAVVVCSKNIQTRETAEIISNQLSLPQYDISDFKPLYLGIIHGLSNEEVANNFPNIFDLLIKWRNKELEICDLLIPGMELPLEFYNRGLKILDRLNEEKYNIFIATNSLYILLINILLGNTCTKGGGYKHFDIPNCGLTMFEKSIDGNYILNNQYTDVQDVLFYKK